MNFCLETTRILLQINIEFANVLQILDIDMKEGLKWYLNWNKYVNTFIFFTFNVVAAMVIIRMMSEHNIRNGVSTNKRNY